MVRDFLARLDHHSGLAFAGPAGTCTYVDLRARVAAWRERLRDSGGRAGDVVSVEGDYDVETIASFLAAAATGMIVVPLSADSQSQHPDFRATARVGRRIQPSGEVLNTGLDAEHRLYARLREQGEAGLVLFSSGSTGPSKAAVHSLDRLMGRYVTPRPPRRTLVFLQLDHIGGVNTLLHTLSNGGTAVIARGRSPEAVCETIATHGVDLLPTSPTFLNMLLMSGCIERYDLSSLRLITYGTEPMPPSTLRRLRDAFPDIRLQQTYGLTELGILRSQSRGPDSLWVRVGGEGYDLKVVDDRLWIKADCAILGYLNAPMAVDHEGYFDTGDLVEVDGEWLRILGRQSEIVNVGGQKVSPARVEDVLLQIDNVQEASVFGEPNALTGQGLSVHVSLQRPEPMEQFKLKMRQFCRERLAPHEIPSRVTIVTTPLHSSRYKQVRPTASPKLEACD